MDIIIYLCWLKLIAVKRAMLGKGATGLVLFKLICCHRFTFMHDENFIVEDQTKMQTFVLLQIIVEVTILQGRLQGR